MNFYLPYTKAEIEEAQEIALRFCNLNSDSLTLKELKHAMTVLSNCVEDVLFEISHKKEIENDSV